MTSGSGSAQTSSSGKSKRWLAALLTLGAVAVALGVGWWIGARNDAQPSYGVTEGSGSVVARVNGQDITTRRVDVELLMQKSLRGLSGSTLTENPADLAAFRRDILDQLVDQTMMAQDATARGIVVDPAAAVAELPQWAAGVDTAALHTAALAAGVSETEFAEWAQGQVVLARYLRDPGAQELGKAEVAGAGGLPRPASAADIAAALEKSADVRFIFSAFGDQDSPSELPMAREGAPAPDFTLKTPSGETVRLSDFKGKPVLLNFWATWCGPCKVEMPLFNHIYEKNSANGLVVLGVNVQEPAALVGPFQTQYGLKFPVALDEDGQVATLYRVRALPTSIFIAPDGTIKEAHRGAIVQRSTLLDIVRTIMPNVGT